MLGLDCLIDDRGVFQMVDWWGQHSFTHILLAVPAKSPPKNMHPPNIKPPPEGLEIQLKHKARGELFFWCVTQVFENVLKKNRPTPDEQNRKYIHSLGGAQGILQYIV